MLVFVAFRRMAGLRQAAVPDVILVLAAVLPWQFFSTALAEASGSLIGNTSLISKVYFPRLIIPVAAVATAFVDFADHARLAGAADGVVRRGAGRAPGRAAALRRCWRSALSLGTRVCCWPR